MMKENLVFNVFVLVVWRMYKQISVHMVSAKMLVLSIYLTLKISLNCIKPGLVFLANSTFRFFYQWHQ